MITNFKTVENLSVEEFTKECKKENIGNLHSIKVLIGISYEQCKLINTDLMQQFKKEGITQEELSELRTLYDQLVMVMQNLENKYNIVLEVIKGIPIIDHV